MFMTLRCGRDEGDGIRCLEATHRPVRNGPNVSASACNSRRAKKLGCSRDLAGCQRCRSRGIKCAYPTERSKAKNSPPQTDARVNLPQAETGHPPLPPIYNSFEPPSSVQGERTTDLQSSSSTSACRPSPTANEKGHEPQKQNQTSVPQAPRSRSPNCQAGSSGASCATNNQHSADDNDDHDDHDDNNMVVLDRPDLATLLSGEQLDASGEFSDKYLSTASDDLFPSLLDTFGDSHDHIGPDRVFRKQPLAPNPPAVIAHVPNEATTLPWLIDLAEGTNGLGFDELGANPLQPPSVRGADIHNPSPRVGPTTANGRGRAPPTDVNFLTTTVDLVDGDDCECTSSALRVLEQVAVPWKGTDLETAERIFCPQDSSFAMLILILYEKIASIFEEVARGWKWCLDRLPQLHGTSQQLCMWLGKYQIDTMEEHYQVLATLITIQLRRLASLVAVAKTSVVGSKWKLS
ncbi:hypothetical protein BDW66DRAFT_154568 [Aspergillus desertorum]